MMVSQLSPATLHRFKLMACAGVLTKEKIKLLADELMRKFWNNNLETDERKILAACILHPDNNRKRMDYLGRELFAWDNRAAN